MASPEEQSSLRDQRLSEHLLFSGTTSMVRVYMEKFTLILEEGVNIALWFLAVGGSLAIIYLIIRAVWNNEWQMLFQANIFNVLFWFGLLAAAALWYKLARRPSHDVKGLFELAEGSVDIYRLFSRHAKLSWNEAILMGRGEPMTAENLFLALLPQPSIKKILARIHVSTYDILVLIKINMELATDSQDLEKLPVAAFELARSMGATTISTPVLLCALVGILPETHMIRAIFSNINIGLDDLKTLARWQLKLPAKKSDVLLSCCYTAEQLEHSKKTFFKYQAIKKIYTLSQKPPINMDESSFAFKLLTQAALEAHLTHKKIVGENFIEKIFTRQSQPATHLPQAQRLKPLIARAI